ncbi:MAG: aminotransferase class I/II-fold pyridoxal phosphate-dependent enzyme, partial [Ilumatobacteraceae bacterium]|nr:aminotransferase class I/II-fold pyridoxal phosphate-dependent enzyme [Ilumatobacteraceae bacterium]
RDTVLFPAVAYPTYEMGAILAGCRAVAVPITAAGGLDLSAISADDAARALMLWVNSPSNPTGALDDLGTAARWGRTNGVPVFSDECYVEFNWFLLF